MKKSAKTLQTQNVSPPQTISGQQMLVEGIIQNLPEILSTVREIYTTHKKGQIFQQVLQTRLGELHINQTNFAELVRALTELSKVENADPLTKDMYREMIKVLFDGFANNMKTAQNMDNYLSKL